MAFSPRRPLSGLLRGATIALCGLAFFAPGREGRAPSARAADSPCAELTPSARRGRSIFHRGVTWDGRSLEGAIVGGAVHLSGREAACARCHGPGGEGTEEGGVKAPPIAAEQLASTTRERVAYTSASLADAIRRGRAPGLRGPGVPRALHPVMPRYTLTDADFADLGGYLACVGHDLDPGVTPGTVTLGTALPLTGPSASLGSAARAVLSAVFDEVNAQGGLYRRHLVLAVEDSAAPGGEAAATTRLLERGVLALVGSAWGGNPTLAARLEDERVPLVGPVGQGASPGGDVVFQIQPGPDVLARVAVQHLAGIDAATRAAGAREGAAVLVVHAGRPQGEAWAAGARTEALRHGLGVPEVLAFEPGALDTTALASAARKPGRRALLFWGPGEDLARCAELLRAPRGRSDVALYAPLGAVGDDPEVRRRLGAQALLVYPGPLGEEARVSGEALRAFLRKAQIPSENAPMSVEAAAYAAARTTIEALKRAGVHVTRERIIAALEGVRGFDAGPIPPVSFARNRRVGVLGASLVRLDPATGDAARASGWIEVVP
ncbi:ABC transporter substrate-binding protein [Chondromyces apiculatus]|uniref:Cytochrome c domain-containing protein n=1 Tax=Chondromyces apiculatus DSM 436 TaxID=1192034 RepID=A0A017STX4_9BACT|nr:ABC transporter substrate-binding protein [Chondromyces apiculatus]EYF00438.1 Hypothetical protein CAP_0845 [Chondromyces apiculatus DSM 436]